MLKGSASADRNSACCWPLPQQCRRQMRQLPIRITHRHKPNNKNIKNSRAWNGAQVIIREFSKACKSAQVGAGLDEPKKSVKAFAQCFKLAAAKPLLLVALSPLSTAKRSPQKGARNAKAQERLPAPPAAGIAPPFREGTTLRHCYSSKAASSDSLSAIRFQPAIILGSGQRGSDPLHGCAAPCQTPNIRSYTPCIRNLYRMRMAAPETANRRKATRNTAL